MKATFLRSWIVMLSLGGLPLLVACTAPSVPPAPAQPEAPAQAAAPAQPSAPAQPAKEQPRRGGLLMTHQSLGEPPSFDVHAETSVGTMSTQLPQYDQLIMYDPLEAGKIVPDLAERWEVSQDGNTYTFFLRKGVTFHNGAPFTAADVKFSLERIKDPPPGVTSYRKETLATVDRIETPDAYTVRITTKRPNPSLLANLAQGQGMVMYSKQFVEANGQEIMKKQPMGTGPFKVKDYIRGVSYELERNPNYWVQGRPYLDGVKIFFIADPNAAFAAFRTGNLHYMGVSVNQAQTLEKESGEKLTIQRDKSLAPITLVLNTQRPPFDNVRVREAISLAIDRDAAIKVLIEGDGDVGGYMPATGVWGLPREELEKIPGYGRDKAANLARAKQLLADAGFPDGFKTTITPRTSQSWIDWAVLAKDQLKKVNIEAELTTPLEAATLYLATDKRDFNILPWGFGLGVDDPDLIFGNLYICKSPRNFSGYCDDEIEALFQKQSQTTDERERKKLVWELERKALASHMTIVMYYGRTRSAVWNTVRDLAVNANPYNYRMRDVWLSSQ
ncbi:MAG: ABC transporter substrate-binding protein [Chloroflexi bacterium]|nr:ABC transporter substrate-binding protein [Chloroflexota bacterium]